MNQPLLSIVTPCLNRARFIEEAIQSAVEQDYPRVEHIIVDGGSTDGTLDILKKYPHLRVISEPDKNLYDALNKGVRAAQGEIVGHLNSDDVYEKNIFAFVAESFVNNPAAEALYGAAAIFDDGDPERRSIMAFREERYRELSFWNLLFGAMNINARFFRKSVYDRLGLYDIRYAIAADRDFLLRVSLANIRYLSSDRFFYHYRQHAGSLTINKPDNPFVLRKAEENIFLCEEYLRRADVPRELKIYLKRLHSKESLMAILWHSQRRQWREAGKSMARAFSSNAAFPLELAKRAGESLLHKIRRNSSRP
ncbi:MAG: glycosyltransferase family 2 protein [Candidatus Omnitrophota bacterium]